MREFLIDSTPVSALTVGHAAALELVVPWMQAHQAATSVLVYGEVVEGLLGRPSFEVRRRRLETLLDEIVPYMVDVAIMRRYASLRRMLRRPYGSGLIGDMDTIIAATALEYDMTLVTTDSDFLRVPGLNLMLLDRLTLTPIERTNGSNTR